MEVLKEKCGRRPRGTSEIGEITAKKVLESNFIRMVINTKACGPWIKNMDREHTGDKKLENSEESTQVIGLKIKNMVVVPSSLKIVIDTMDIGLMVCHKVKVE